MFHVTLLICAYFKRVSYYFCVSGIESTRNWRIIYLFYFVLKFWGFSRYLFCVFLCLLIWNQGKMPPGKIFSWKKSFKERMPTPHDTLLEQVIFMLLVRELIH